MVYFFVDFCVFTSSKAVVVDILVALVVMLVVWLVGRLGNLLFTNLAPALCHKIRLGSIPPSGVNDYFGNFPLPGVISYS